MVNKHIPTLLLLACLLVAGGAQAQSGKLKRGQRMMDDLAYHDAIALYNQVLENSDEAEAKINLAEAYRKVNDPENAEFWYGQVVRLPEAQPIHKLYYGMMLQRNGKCSEAAAWYQQYVEAVPDDLRGQYLLRACTYEEELMTKNAGSYEVKHTDFNSSFDDFSPAFYGDGLVFSSERDQGAAVRREYLWTGNPFLELYYVDAKQMDSEDCGNVVFGRPDKFSPKLNTKYNDAAVAFSADQQEIYFTRNNILDGNVGESDDGIVKLKVFYAKSLGEGKWGELQSLPFNSDEYNVVHPALSNDGSKLYFSSDMPGGFGGMDLYVSEQESGRWGPPMNLGPAVNTEGHEIFPKISTADGRLYFASDGQVGLGGLDIYYVTDRGNGDWAEPTNLGYPINTISDDFGIIFNEAGTCGYFSSDRQGGVGRDDIYSFKKIAMPVEVFVFDAATGQPLDGAEVAVSCRQETLTTNLEGRISIDMKPNELCEFVATYDEYEANNGVANTEGRSLDENLVVEIPLERAATFELSGTVWDVLADYPVADAVVMLTNDCGQDAQTFVTDIEGRFNFKLDKDCAYEVKAEKSNYLMAKDAVTTKGLSESESFRVTLNLQPTSIDPTTFDPNQAFDNDYTYRDPSTGTWTDKGTGAPANGTYPDGKVYVNGVLQGTEGGYVPLDGKTDANGNIAVPFLVHVYYDFNEASLRSDSDNALYQLLQVMNENPDIIVEIGSHTDARGNSRYNNRLSQRRAQSVVDWLTNNGISRERLVSRGYGESVPVNQCSNNIPCSEREHQMNRRTEFKVVGCLTCVDPTTKAISSQPQTDVKVDECGNCPF